MQLSLKYGNWLTPDVSKELVGIVFLWREAIHNWVNLFKVSPNIDTIVKGLTGADRAWEYQYVIEIIPVHIVFSTMPTIFIFFV